MPFSSLPSPGILVCAEPSVYTTCNRSHMHGTDRCCWVCAQLSVCMVVSFQKKSFATVFTFPFSSEVLLQVPIQVLGPFVGLLTTGCEAPVQVLCQMCMTVEALSAGEGKLHVTLRSFKLLLTVFWILHLKNNVVFFS